MHARKADIYCFGMPIDGTNRRDSPGTTPGTFLADVPTALFGAEPAPGPLEGGGRCPEQLGQILKLCHQTWNTHTPCTHKLLCMPKTVLAHMAD